MKEVKYPETINGLSITIAFGQYANPCIQFFKGSIIFRLCLGWLGITILKYDIEAVMALYLAELNKAENKIAELSRNCKEE